MLARSCSRQAPVGEGRRSAASWARYGTGDDGEQNLLQGSILRTTVSGAGKFQVAREDRVEKALSTHVLHPHEILGLDVALLGAAALARRGVVRAELMVDGAVVAADVEDLGASFVSQWKRPTPRAGRWGGLTCVSWHMVTVELELVLELSAGTCVIVACISREWTFSVSVLSSGMLKQDTTWGKCRWTREEKDGQGRRDRLCFSSAELGTLFYL